MPLLRVVVLLLVSGRELVRHLGDPRGDAAADGVTDGAADRAPDPLADTLPDALSDRCADAAGYPRDALNATLDAALEAVLNRALDQALQVILLPALDRVLFLRVAAVVGVGLAGIRLDRFLGLPRVLHLLRRRRELDVRRLHHGSLFRPRLHRRNRDDQHREDGGGGQRARPGQSAARHAGIENRHQPALELRALRHRQARAGQDGREAAGAHHAGDVEQLVGVVGAARARGEHEIVAGTLALGAQAPRRHPGQRVEPVGRAGDLRDEVGQAVAALHVRELVQQHDAEAMRRPGVGVGRHQHRRAEDSPRHRHRGRAGPQEADAREPEAAGERLRLREPGRVGHRRRAARHPEDRRETEEHAPEDRGRAGKPGKEHDRAPGDRCAAGGGDP